MKRFLSLMGLLGVLSFGATANAQLVGLYHVWTVPGVMQTANGLGTFVACTNSGTASATIGVDVYGSTGAYVSGNSLSVAAGATVLFGTSNANGLSVDVSLNTGVVSKGHARIFASTTRGILCSAFLADENSGVPAAMTNLSIIKKFSQKGN